MSQQQPPDRTVDGAAAGTDQSQVARWRDWARIGLFVLLVAGVGGALLATGGPTAALERIREVVDSAGLWGPVLFVLAYAVLTILLVPGSPLTIAGGSLFGPFVGTALVVVGATLGATGAFVWGRRLGRDGVARLTGDRFEKIDEWLDERGFLAVLYVRLVPVFPFNLLNPVAGVTDLRLRDFVLGTLVGIVPGTFAYSALGGSFDDPLSPTFLSAVGLAVVLAVGAPLVDRRVRGSDDAADDA